MRAVGELVRKNCNDHIRRSRLPFSYCLPAKVTCLTTHRPATSCINSCNRRCCTLLLPYSSLVSAKSWIASRSKTACYQCTRFTLFASAVSLARKSEGADAVLPALVAVEGLYGLLITNSSTAPLNCV
jgi:hypothetical protein